MVLRATMKNDISAINYFHKLHQIHIPLFDYTALETLLEGYKDFQKFRVRTQRYPIKFEETIAMVEYLISTGLFSDRVFVFEIIVAWVCCLRTGEHVIDSGNHIHTTSTVYWISCSRPFPNLK